MEEDGIFGWDSQYFTKEYIKCVRFDYIDEKKYCTPPNTAKIIQRGIIEAVRSYIHQQTNKLTLTFDIDGVKKMLAFICENKYNTRNYTYTNDWALTNLRDKPEFMKLEEEEKKIEVVSTPQIYDKLYFNKENFIFNIEILKIKFVDLTERECEVFLNDSKGYNGLYNVNGILMSKEKAMEYIEKLYCKEKISFKLMIDIGENDMTHIEFE